MKVIDLTYSLSKDIPTWDGSYNFELSIDTDYKDCTIPDIFRTNKVKCGAGVGTHMDAPAHVAEGGRTIDFLREDELIINCIVIDVSNEADENYIIIPDVISKFEKEHGVIPKKSFVIFYTGWSKYWEDRDKYRNNYKFPSVHEDTAKLLLERGIVGLGTDTLSADVGANGFPVHRMILGGDKYLVENIANVDKVPSVGAKIFIMPMKIKDATEAPVRIFAVIDFLL